MVKCKIRMVCYHYRTIWYVNFVWHTGLVVQMLLCFRHEMKPYEFPFGRVITVVVQLFRCHDNIFHVHSVTGLVSVFKLSTRNVYVDIMLLHSISLLNLVPNITNTDICACASNLYLYYMFLDENQKWINKREKQTLYRNAWCV